MRVLDLFSGIGGFRLGMEQAEHETVGWIEMDKFARQSYQAIHQPEGEWTHDDIRTVDYRDIPKADSWTFGFPCQDISVAGKRTGFKGDRSSLFFTVTELLRKIKKEDSSRLPSYIIAENVRNFLSINGGWDFLCALSELDQIGYDCEWQLLNSKNFGVPQNRQRVFIVGHLRGRRTRKVFPIERANTEVTLQQIIGGRQGARVYDPTGLSCSLNSSGGGSGANTGLYLFTKNKGNLVSRSSFTCLDASYHKGIDDHGARTGVMEVRPILTPDREIKRQNGRRMKESGEPMFTLTAQDRHGVVFSSGDSISRTVRTGGRSSLDAKHTWDIVQDRNYRIRKLTPRECWRLQGFPDSAFDRAKEAGISDTQLYRQAGNAVAVPIIYEMGKRMNIDNR
ncbi:DNA (cytosine-5)-methyltransferase 1 [Thermoactinomyces sp. DSM 45891]|uniref:DNA cytosine methyltransferase n=1 Tax=Thermoactinomyces sp. DSM 45891 TaxID=1761907 RepID=UPI00091D7192|nr:DNA cytosine methyltransferase [Thermoactinomyces sp. DSM 45891]SFX82621.1 DNA (cytosine-5)-methyltransferase 1 [Thermoactinomyces sp. DSM 45891]